jgi:hypothetical protein
MGKLGAIILICLIIAVTAGCVTTGEKTRYYNTRGEFVGTSTTTETGTRYYGVRGNYIGRSK